MGRRHWATPLTDLASKVSYYIETSDANPDGGPTIQNCLQASRPAPFEELYATESVKVA